MNQIWNHILVPVLILLLFGCAGNSSTSPDAGAGPGPFTDFPATPILDGTAPASSPTLFPAGGGGGGPCLVEPEPGALFPSNWLRPRFRYLPASGENLFELRVHAAREVNDLVVYTSNPSWTMPQSMWRALASHILDEAITITIRGGVFDGQKLTAGPTVGAAGDIKIAPADASGSIVYWTTSSGSALKGFSVGDESVHPLLTPAAVQTGCIGCHTSTPDGMFAAMSASDNPGDGAPARIELRSVDGLNTRPSFLSTVAATLLARTQQEAPQFSAAHWASGDRVALSMLEQNGKTEIAWTNLEATDATQGVGWGLLARTGDNGSAASASFAHDGTRIAYVSGPAVNSGVNVYGGGADLHMIPYAARMGGASTPIQGASDPAWSEFYPSFSPDDRLLVFDRVPAAETSYNNANDELFFVRSTGGDPVRAAANDPPACSGRASPGVTNSWAKWSPTVSPTSSKTYYWIIFSSTRDEQKNPQLYMTGIEVPTGELTAANIITHGAVYLWNQPAAEDNHTPAWDLLQIPLM